MNVGSFPKDFDYQDEYDPEAAGGPSADNKPRILLMGLRRLVIENPLRKLSSGK
jgi:Ras-related GTP-binding protein C/D